MSHAPASKRAFYDQAAAFCAWLEDDSHASFERSVPLLAGWLGALYAAAVDLPDLTPDDHWPDAAEGYESSLPIRKAMEELLGQHDRYWTVFDPQQREASVEASLADDITDIYRDLNAGLELASAGRMDAAIWEWRNSFSRHWGRHAAEAIRALHALWTAEL